MMVAVTTKPHTTRKATATATVLFPPSVRQFFFAKNTTKRTAAVAVGGGGKGVGVEGGDLMSKKGPVLATSIIAGIMGAKRCPELIPMCHPIALTQCLIEADLLPRDAGVRLTCTATTVGPTGVEMEALTGASIAGLTVYDMLKGIPGAQPGLRIAGVRLLQKSGGKSDILVASSRRRHTAVGGVAPRRRPGVKSRG